MYWLHALTPLHVGAGRGVGFIDLPVAREKVTGWPLAPGSGIKGVLADHHKATDENRKINGKLSAAFGRGGEDLSNSGALVFTDARIVCLPVRSLYGTFAWVTSPLALRRMARDLENVKPANSPTAFPEVGAANELHVPEKASALGAPIAYFEDLDFTVTLDSVAGKWATFIAETVFTDDFPWRGLFEQRFGVVADDVFNFLCETATEVNARVRIDDDSKIVAKGTILAGLVSCEWVTNKSHAPSDLLKDYCETALTLQMGGKATTGKGTVRCVFQGGNG
ncbi:MAG: type III-B CRISPR module RAMP protein Cmr4 [Gammaproteobacteria bacterium]